MRLTLTVIRSPPNLHLLLKRRLAVTPKLCRFLDGGCFDPFEPETDSLTKLVRILQCIVFDRCARKLEQSAGS
jgi:hypothetical protein